MFNLSQIHNLFTFLYKTPNPLARKASILYFIPMNQDQVTDILKKIEPNAAPFTLLFSGKESNKAYGVYHPDKGEIIIHNRNFVTDDGVKEGALLYTAVHEFAHHIHFTTSPVPVGHRAHTRAFREIFHGLLEKAESNSLLDNPFTSNEDMKAVTDEIRQKILTTQGQQARDFGILLIKAQGLCEKYGLRFEDYVERNLQFDQSTIKTIMRIPAFEIPPQLGYENMKLIAAEKKQDARAELTRRLMSGESRDLAKGAVKPLPKEPEEENLKKLQREKDKLEKTIMTLEAKLHEVENRLMELE